MAKAQRGNIVTVVLLVAILVSVIGFGGFYVYNQNKKDNKSAATNNTPSTTPSTDKQTPEVAAEPKVATYSFTELGIKMNILDGWTVASTPSKDYYGNVYHWEVTKPGADGKIVLDSRGFLGGWGADCSVEGSAFATVQVHDVAPTKNNKFILLSWTESYSTPPNSYTGTVVASAGGKEYSASKEPESPELANSTLKPGAYFRCNSGPYPGTFLGLSKEDSKDSARNDSISAVKTGPGVSADSKENISTNNTSYADIKKMLTSIE